ncbi:patched domain-containing protein 3-like [Liolophura sinensis]|uniref:patched domain-containing protein 3-like n=1 Tax=Liolophura sinensis TaxID=3198878 RepID=UPI0031590DD2
MGCLLKFRTNVNAVFSSAFAWYGRRVGTYPWVFVLGSITVNALLGLGILRLTPKTGIEDVYVPIGNQAANDRILLKALFPDKSNTDFYQHHLPDDGKYGAVVFRSTDLKNVLRTAVLDEIETVYQSILNISFADPVSNSQLDYRSVCARRSGNCITDGDYVFSAAFKTDKDAQNVSYPKYNVPGYGQLDLSSSLGQVGTQNGLLQSAGSLKIRFHLRQDSANSSELSSRWEDAFIRAIGLPAFGQGQTLSELAYATSDSLNEELEKNTGGDIKWFSLTFTLMITYASIASSGGNWVSSRGYLACAGVLAAGLGIVSGMGLVSLCGMPFTSIVGVMPFLVLGIGVDDTFVMLSGWSETHGMSGIPERLAVSLASSGLSITLTSLTDVIAFCIGASSPFLSVRAFCVYTGVAILFCYVNQITLFAGCLAIHARRVERNLHIVTCMKVPSKREVLNAEQAPKTPVSESSTIPGDTQAFERDPSQDHSAGTNPRTDDVTNNHRRPPPKVVQSTELAQPGRMPVATKCKLCFCVGEPPQNKYEDESVFEKIPRYFLPKIISSSPVKIIICPLYFVYIGVSIWGVTDMEQGLDVKNLVLPTSYYRFSQWNEDYFDSQFMITFIINGDLAYHENPTQARLGDFIRKVTQDKYIRDDFLLSWMEAYHVTPFLNTTSEADYIAGFKSFLAYRPEFQNDVNFNLDFSKILSSRFYLKTVGITSSMRQGDMMRQMRELAKNSGLPITAFSPPFIYFEQFVVILSNTLQTVGIAVCAMFVLSFFFLPYPLIVLHITITMTTIMLGIFGFMHFWGLSLSSVTMIHLVMSVGFSIDYCAHICHAVMHCLPEGTSRQHCVSLALGRVGGPILNGALSSLIGVIMLVNSESYIFKSFFKMMLLVIAFGLLHSILILPAFLSVLGPLPSDNEERVTNGVKKLAEKNLPLGLKLQTDSQNAECSVQCQPVT